jgi:hypothetical protein
LFSLNKKILLCKTGFLAFDFEPVGKWFEIYNFQKHQGDVLVEEDEGTQSSDSSDEEDDSEEYEKYVKTLDPRNCKVRFVNHVRFSL